MMPRYFYAALAVKHADGKILMSLNSGFLSAVSEMEAKGLATQRTLDDNPGFSVSAVSVHEA